MRLKARGTCDIGLTPKPRAEGSSPSAPAKIRSASNDVLLLFYAKKPL